MGGLAAAGAIGAAAGTASAATTRRGIQFDRVVDVVDDLGLDPTGNEPIQWKLNNAKEDGTLFVFPEGEYLVTDRILMIFEDTIGLLGKGDVRFKVPERYNDWAVIMDHGQNALFENIDIDLRADGATPGCRFAGYNDVQVHDLEMVGQGIHPKSGTGENPTVNAAFGFIARAPDAHVLAENVVARNKGYMGAYNHGNGRLGGWIGNSNEGTVTLRNCHFSGFPNNGLYTSRTPGVVQVEGGVYRNNDVSQVRLGSKGSYVKDALIEVNPSKSQSPNPEDMLNARGVRIESGRIDTAGVTVENCDIFIAKDASSQGGVVAARPAGMFDVVDTRIRVDADDTPAILGQVPDGGRAYDTPPGPHRARIVNVSVTGSASNGPAIKVQSRPESTIRSCCVEQRSANRHGVSLSNSRKSVVRESTFTVTGETVQTNTTDTKVWGNSTGGSCPLPQSGVGSEPTSGTSDPDSETDDSTSSDSGSRKRLAIRGDEKPVKYWVKVSGDLQRTKSVESSDEISGSTASGWVGNWKDAFSFTGHVEKLVVQGDATLVYERSADGPDVLRFKGNSTGEILKYTGAVSGSFWRNGTSEANDELQTTQSGDRVSGWFGGWNDSFNCKGDFQAAQIDGILETSVSEEA